MAGRILPKVERVQGLDGSAAEAVVSSDDRQDHVTHVVSFDFTTHELQIGRDQFPRPNWTVLREYSAISVADALCDLEMKVKRKIAQLETCLDLIDEEVYTKRFEERADQLYPE